MKKILLFLATAALVTSCNKLAENEYEITGTIDPSMNGKSIYLEKQGGYMGFVPVDTVKVENGKFIFKDTVGEPALYFIGVEGDPGSKANFILEPGNIVMEINKDSIFRSKRSGTYNNDKLTEYYDKLEVMNKKRSDFMAKNNQAMMDARKDNDTVVINRLTKEYEVIGKEMEDINTKFIKDNPKAFISVLMVKQIASSGAVPLAELKELYGNLDSKVKNTKEGKEVAKIFTELEQQEANKANVSVGKKAPGFSAPNPEGKQVSLAESMGKVTIIDFWASWCKPCRMENPNVVAMYKELHGKGLNIIGVSLDRDAAKWKEAIAADNLTWNHISNLKFWEEPIAQMYGVKSIPATFILDENGTIVATDLRGDELKAKVEELLAK